jgi:hypothetical protein
MGRHTFNTHPHNNNVRLHKFIHGEKSDSKITLKLEGIKLFTSRNMGKQQCLIICNLQKVKNFAIFLFHISFKHIFSHVHIMELKFSFHFQN